MRIGLDLQTQSFRRRLGRPNLCPPEEEPLLWGISIDQRRPAFGREIIHQRRVSDVQTAEIADVLADRTLTFDVQAGQHLIAAELVNDTRGTLFKFRAVLGRPPIDLVSFGVVLAALVVETMRNLVADHSTHSAVVDGIVRLKVKERRLKDSGWECDVVA